MCLHSGRGIAPGEELVGHGADVVVGRGHNRRARPVDGPRYVVSDPPNHNRLEVGPKIHSEIVVGRGAVARDGRARSVVFAGSADICRLCGAAFSGSAVEAEIPAP